VYELLLVGVERTNGEYVDFLSVVRGLVERLDNIHTLASHKMPMLTRITLQKSVCISQHPDLAELNALSLMKKNSFRRLRLRGWE
jgi:hypothetical protein